MMNFEKHVKNLAKLFQERAPRELNKFMPASDLKERLNLDLPERPAGDAAIENFLGDVFSYSVNTHHPYYVNQLWSQTEESSVLGELLTAMTNTSMYTYEAAPVATLLENDLIDQLGKRVWNSACDGVMTSGGTASNLQAILIARNEISLKVKEQGLLKHKEQLVLLAAKNCHYSIKRAANILGIGHENLWEVEVTSQGEMIPQDLIEKLNQAKKKRVRPFCVVSTAGTTIEGSFDNLQEIGKICQENELWFHVDGAYGASVLLSESHKELMKGVELAQSLSWDFHKMLGLNLPCAFLLLKGPGLLKKSLNTQNDDYLFHEDNSIDLGPKSMQCGRRNDALKLWLTWMNYGKEGLENRINTLFKISKQFSELIEDEPRFELIQKPQSINVCFRFKEINSKEIPRIRQNLQIKGELMINYSQDDKGPFFRLALTNPCLNKSDLEQIIHLIAKESL